VSSWVGAETVTILLGVTGVVALEAKESGTARIVPPGPITEEEIDPEDGSVAAGTIVLTTGIGFPFKIELILPSVVVRAGRNSPNKLVSDGMYTPLGTGVIISPSSVLVLHAGLVNPITPLVTSPYISGELLIKVSEGLSMTLFIPAGMVLLVVNVF
jgi:hypothetical protein